MYGFKFVYLFYMVVQDQYILFLFVMHYIGLFRLCLAQWLIDEFGDSNIIFFYFFKIAKYSFKFSHHSTIIITLKENQTATHYTSK